MSERRRPRPERPPRTGAGDAVAGRGRGVPVDWVPHGPEAEREAPPGAEEPSRGAEPSQRRPPPPPGEPPRADDPPPGDDPFAEDDRLGAGPPPGWEHRESGADGGRPPPRPDATQLLALLDGLRGAVPRELQEQLTTLLREFLLALRALIDWYLERLDAPRREPEVEDIPID